MQANSATNPREGSLTIAGINFSISQARACTYSISPAQANVAAAAGTGTVAVTAPSGCAWTATSNTSWAGITSGAQGSGDGVVTYSVAGNATAAVRQGSLTIAGLAFAISQAAPVPSGDIHVPAGGDLQAALDQIQPGRTITLEPGATYVGHFLLRNKPGTEYITITTADPSKLPPPGKRISPAYAPICPKSSRPMSMPPSPPTPVLITTGWSVWNSGLPPICL